MHLIYNRLDSEGEDYNKVIDPFEKPYITKFTMNTLWSGITGGNILNVIISDIIRPLALLSRIMVSSGRHLFMQKGACLLTDPII